MGAFIGLIPPKVWLAIGVAAVLAASHGFAYRLGKSSEHAATLQRSIETLREKEKVNRDVKNMDDRQLCVALGGVYENGECL